MNQFYKWLLQQILRRFIEAGRDDQLLWLFETITATTRERYYEETRLSIYARLNELLDLARLNDVSKEW